MTIIPFHFKLIYKRLATSFLFVYAILTFAFFFLDIFIRQFRHFDLILLFKHFLHLTFQKADVFVPFSFLLAISFTIASLKEHFEIQILQAAGLSKKALILPFYLFALTTLLFSYLNYELILPKLTPWIKYEKRQKHQKTNLAFNNKILPDKTRIIYQNKSGKMCDLFWIISSSEIWHAKEVILNDSNPKGLYVDIFKKNSANTFEKIASYKELGFNPLILEAKKSPKPKETLSLIKTFRTLFSDSSKRLPNRAKIETLFIYKLVSPFYPFLFATAFLPLLFIYHKSFRAYLLYLLALFAFLIFYSMIKTFIILGESYVVAPWITLALIPFICQGALSYRLWKA